MKRSRAVHLTLVASASSAAVGAAASCAGPAPAREALHCVERGSSRVVADSLCEGSRVASGYGRSGAFGAATGSSGEFGGPEAATTHGTGGSYMSPFLWYYGGRVASGFASAGGYVPREGARYRSSAGFVASGAARRGFFGRTFGGAFGRSASSPGIAGRAGAVSRGGFGATGAGHGGSNGG